MGTLVFGRVAETGSLSSSGTTMYQPFRTNDDIILIGLRHWIIFYNNPTIENLRCKIYADDFSSGVHTPSTQIAASTKVWTKAEIITLANGFFEIYYDFNSIPLQASTFYHVVFHADTYTSPSESSHVAFRTAYPDPVYSLNLTVNATLAAKAPLALYFVGASF